MRPNDHNSLFVVRLSRTGLDVLLLKGTPKAREFFRARNDRSSSSLNQFEQIYSMHRRICGSNPFRWPLLSRGEADRCKENGIHCSQRVDAFRAAHADFDSFDVSCIPFNLDSLVSFPALCTTRPMSNPSWRTTAPPSLSMKRGYALSSNSAFSLPKTTKSS